MKAINYLRNFKLNFYLIHDIYLDLSNNYRNICSNLNGLKIFILFLS